MTGTQLFLSTVIGKDVKLISTLITGLGTVDYVSDVFVLDTSLDNGIITIKYTQLDSTLIEVCHFHVDLCVVTGTVLLGNNNGVVTTVGILEQ